MSLSKFRTAAFSILQLLQDEIGADESGAASNQQLITHAEGALQSGVSLAPKRASH